MPTELKVIKLVNGDEVIGFIEDGGSIPQDEESDRTTHNLIFIKGAMRVVQEYNNTTRGHNLYLIDWMPSAKSNVLPIPKDKIITMDTPQDSVEEHYLELMNDQLDQEDAERDPEQEAEEKKNEALEKLKKHKFEDDDLQ